MVGSYNIPLCDSECPKSRYCSKIHVLSIIYLTKNVTKSLSFKFSQFKILNIEININVICITIYRDIAMNLCIDFLNSLPRYLTF